MGLFEIKEERNWANVSGYLNKIRRSLTKGDKKPEIIGEGEEIKVIDEVSKPSWENQI